MVKDMQTASKARQYRQKKEKNRLTGSSQVYGRNGYVNVTEILRFKNGTCTSVLFVDDPFTILEVKSGNFCAVAPLQPGRVV